MIHFSLAPEVALVGCSPKIAGLLCRPEQVNFFCSGMTGASVGEYRGSKGSHETTKSPEAWAA